MTLRRGFKTEANTTSREIRAELGLAAGFHQSAQFQEVLKVNGVPLVSFTCHGTRHGGSVAAPAAFEGGVLRVCTGR